MLRSSAHHVSTLTKQEYYQRQKSLYNYSTFENSSIFHPYLYALFDASPADKQVL